MSNKKQQFGRWKRLKKMSKNWIEEKYVKTRAGLYFDSYFAVQDNSSSSNFEYGNLLTDLKS